MLSETPLFAGHGYPVLQNRVYETHEAALACQTGDIRLIQNEESGLVYNAAFDSKLVTYDEGYDNEQGHSPAFRAHLDNVRALLQRHFGGRTVLEVGCGKGLFLDMMRGAGFDVAGVDPSYVGDDPRVVRALYEPGLGLRADCIVLRHVLEHIDEPFSFLEMLAEANNGGLIYIEVPCLEWIASKGTWFDIFYEHVNYFRQADLSDMFGKTLASERLFNGQYIGIVADLSTLRSPSIERTGEFVLPETFLTELDYLSRTFCHRRHAIWGGASKGVIYSLLMQQRGAGPVCAIDINPAKQGRFMGASAVQIVSPEVAEEQLSEGETVLVMNNNYLDEIRALTRGRYNLRAADQ